MESKGLTARKKQVTFLSYVCFVILRQYSNIVFKANQNLGFTIEISRGVVELRIQRITQVENVFKKLPLVGMLVGVDYT